MRLTNTTSHPTHFLRRLVNWCRDQLDLPSKRCRRVHFGMCSHRGSGMAYWPTRIIVRMGRTKSLWPWTHQYRKGAPSITFTDQMEWLVHLTAHELWHLVQYMERTKTRETGNEIQALRVLEAFRQRKLKLAQTKVRKLRAKVQRYERVAAKRAQ